MALEALIAWEGKFSPTKDGSGLQMYISANFGSRVRSTTFGGAGDANAAAAIEEVDLDGDSHFSHVRLEAKGTGRAQAVISTEYLDSYTTPKGRESDVKPLVLDASISTQEGRNSFVVTTCQR